MSNLISNSATINYNGGNTAETCPICTNIDKGLEVAKRAYTSGGTVIEASTEQYDGVVGEDRRILYGIELTNYGSTTLTGITIEDTITITNPDGSIVILDGSEIIPEPKTVQEGASFAMDPEIPNQLNITLTTPLEPDTERFVRFELNLPDTVQVGATITNTAEVDYDQNPSTEPLETETLDILFTYTQLTAEKAATDLEGNPITSVLCGDQFKYVLTFTNTGSETANVDSVTDLLPEEFIIVENPTGTYPGVTVRLETIEGAVTPKTQGVDYTVNVTPFIPEGQFMTIEPPEGSITNNIDIPVNSSLIMEIQGTADCSEP